MESYLNDIDGILRLVADAELQADELIAEFGNCFQKVLSKYKPANETPVKPNKKKAKGRVGKIDSLDDDDSEDSSVSLSRNGTLVTGHTLANGQIENETTRSNESQFLRPVRAGRAKPTCYKEPPLNTKMRNNETTKIKLERTSSVSNLPDRSVADVNVVRVKREKESISGKVGAITATATVHVGNESNNNNDKQSSKPDKAKQNSADENVSRNKDRVKTGSSSSKKTDDSLEIVPMEANPLIQISDDDDPDDGEKMPPPAFIPPTMKAAREKKQSSKSRSNQSNASNATNTVDETSVESITQTTRSTRSKQPRRKIKKEPVSESDEESTTSVSSTANNTNKSTKQPIATTTKPNKETTDKTQPSRELNMSGDSLYEDAVSEQPKNIFNSYVRIEKNTKKAPQIDTTSACNAITLDENESRLLSPRATYVIEKESTTANANNADVTFDVGIPSSASGQALNNETIVITSNNGAIPKKKLTNSSVMTEDNSDSEPSQKDNVPATNTLKSKKNPKEIFNPCVEKTMKQKVEAFEKLQSPVSQRETRTKTRLATDPDKLARAHNLMSQRAIALEQHNKHLRTNSATRYAPTGLKSAHVLTKSSSVEELRKKNQAVVDEKKKKRDEKIRQAQQQREAQEKEKAEKLRKLFEEREQRMKEIQLQKQQEEMLKLLEQKRKEAEREQIRKDMKAAADRKERDNLKILDKQRILQEKLKANKRAAELERNRYHFDMLESGDSTDDERKTSNKRPAPPSWSTSQNRMPYIVAQSKIDTKVVDAFFSVEAHHVDLRQIFPQIDEKYLRRNSSAVWHETPRYSTLPKY